MSFVTSNVEALLEDLRERPYSTELLREYVDDVLAATLDGLARVNTIVADPAPLRARRRRGLGRLRLANREVAAAVRMAQVPSKFGCRVELDLGEVPRLFGRPQQIVQLVVNLVVNAGQASGPTGHVRVSTRQEPDAVVLAIEDDGAGMAPETRARLFTPFFTTKRVGEGTGLGLAVVHGIVKAHGGSIEVRSELGKGSTFTVRLPRSQGNDSSTRVRVQELLEKALASRQSVRENEPTVVYGPSRTSQKSRG